MKTEDIARICHAANRAFCATHGDTSHLPWDDSPEDLKRSVRAGVDTALLNPQVTARQMFEKWKQWKMDEGWVFGLVKDPEHKEHPNLVAYEELPPRERIKDVLFLAIVRALENE